MGCRNARVEFTEAEEKTLAAAQGSQETKESEARCDPRRKTKQGKITRSKICIKGRDKAKRERGRKEARNLFSWTWQLEHRDGIQRLCHWRLRGNDD